MAKPRSRSKFTSSPPLNLTEGCYDAFRAQPERLVICSRKDTGRIALSTVRVERRLTAILAADVAGYRSLCLRGSKNVSLRRFSYELGGHPAAGWLDHLFVACIGRPVQRCAFRLGQRIEVAYYPAIGFRAHHLPKVPANELANLPFDFGQSLRVLG